MAHLQHVSSSVVRLLALLCTGTLLASCTAGFKVGGHGGHHYVAGDSCTPPDGLEEALAWATELENETGGYAYHKRRFEARKGSLRGHWRWHYHGGRLVCMFYENAGSGYSR